MALGQSKFVGICRFSAPHFFFTSLLFPIKLAPLPREFYFGLFIFAEFMRRKFEPHGKFLLHLTNLC